MKASLVPCSLFSKVYCTHGTNNFIFTEIKNSVKRHRYLLITLLGSALLWAAWPVSPLTVLIFVAWVPLLWIEDHIGSWKKLLALCYVHMLFWNVATTWWIWNASEVGAMSAFIANSLIMCLPWILFYFTKKKLGRLPGYAALIIYWVSFEYLHHNWELSWPWLTLGNVFAMKPGWVQWYEYTGSTGGSIWVLLTNIVAYSTFREFSYNGRSRRYFARLGALIAILSFPIVASRLIRAPESGKVALAQAKATRNVVVVQPNIDPYEEKFASPVEAQVEKLIRLSEQQIDDSTALVVWPETAIPAQVWEDRIKANLYYQPVWSFLNRHPQLDLLTGIDSYKNYGPDKENAPPTARPDPNSGTYYDAFNTAAFFDADTSIDLYHKAKLVPGVETLPSFLNFMGKWFENFGGISGTLGRDSERKVFADRDNTFRSAPVICYESIYSDYITEYVRKGANLLTIITNDGWWDDTPGYRQHMNYARLRAIETRMWVARSANTGISCFIDPLGSVISPQPWDTDASIRLRIPSGSRQTFFVKHGDYLSRIAAWLCAVMIVLLIVKSVLIRLSKRKSISK